MDYEKLKEVIAKQIKENGKREITGPVLQAVLMAMVDSLGEVYPHTYTDEEKAQARANIDALSNHNGEITKEKLSLEVQAILNDVANKQNISDATLATIAKTIVGAINEVYKGGLEDASIATSKIKDGAVTDANIANGAVTTPKIANDAVTTEKVYDGAITEPKLDTDLVNIITSAVQPAELASAIATALASYVAKADIVDTTGSATDKVMSQHGVTEAIDGVTNKVTELESICTINDSNIQSFINYNNSPLFKGWINGASFMLGDDYDHKIIPVNGGQIITIKAGEGSTKIAIVKSYTPPTQNNNFIDYATGESERVVSVGKESTIVTCPSDAKYIIIGDRYVSHNTRPSILEIDGHNLFDSILGDIQESREAASKAKSELHHEEAIIGKIGKYETNPDHTNATLYLGWKSPYTAFLQTIKINANSTSESIYVVKLNEDNIVISSKRYIINNLIIGSERTYDISDMNILLGKGDFVVMQHLNFSYGGTTNKGDIQFSAAPNVSTQGSQPGNRSFCFEAEINITIGGFIESLVSKENEELRNKTYLVIGDSISDPSLTSQATKRYFDWLEEIDNMVIINDGKSGTGYVRALGSYANIPTRITNYTFDTPDYISIFAGTNDWYGNSGEGACDLGQYGDTASSGTFYGALEDTFTKLINKYPSSKILIALPIHRYVESSPNARGNTLLQFVNAIREVAFKYSFTVIDLYNEGGVNPLFESLQNEYFGEREGTHPNNKGHKRLYPKFKQGLLRT